MDTDLSGVLPRVDPAPLEALRAGHDPETFCFDPPPSLCPAAFRLNKKDYIADGAGGRAASSRRGAYLQQRLRRSPSVRSMELS